MAVHYPQILWRNREKAMEDQFLRAKNTGFDMLTNPNAYRFRRSFGRLYYQFKVCPGLAHLRSTAKHAPQCTHAHTTPRFLASFPTSLQPVCSLGTLCGSWSSSHASFQSPFAFLCTYFLIAKPISLLSCT